MANRIDKKLASLKINKQIAVVPYLTVGYPNISSSYEIALSLLNSGADMLELGIPFSDPLADGPIIQMTSFRALENGVNLDTAFKLVQKLRIDNNESPLIFMGYYNPFLNYGIAKFVSYASSIGVDGVIIPDLPAEESGEVARECLKHNIHLIPLLAPTSTEERIVAACANAGGFIYCVSLTGVTGAKNKFSQNVERLVNKIRNHTDLPILVGFGVSNKSDIQRITNFADGAIVGSALLNAISRADINKESDEAKRFIEGLI